MIHMDHGHLNINASWLGSGFGLTHHDVLEYYLDQRPSVIWVYALDGEPLVDLGFVAWLHQQCQLRGIPASGVRWHSHDERIRQWFPDFNPSVFGAIWNQSSTMLKQNLAQQTGSKIWGLQLFRMTLPRLMLAYRIDSQWPDTSHMICRFGHEDLDHLRRMCGREFDDAIEWAKNRVWDPDPLFDEWRRNVKPQDLDVQRAPMAVKGYADICRHYRIDVICETHTTNPFWFTEKTSRVIVARKPFVFFGSQGALHQLRQMGFKTFHPWIDESYDLGHSWKSRLDSMIDSMHKIIDTGIDTVLAAVQPQIDYNFVQYKRTI